MKTNYQTLAWFNPHLKFWMGGTKFILEVLVRLSPQFQSTIVCNGGSQAVIQKFRKANIGVKSLLPINSNSPIYWFCLPLFLIIEILKSHRVFRQSDVVIATLFPSNLLCALLGKLYHKQYCFYCFEPFPFLQNQQFIDAFPTPKRIMLNFLRVLYAPLDKWATQQAAKVFTLNQITQKTIHQVYGVNSIITLMGVDTHHFSLGKVDKQSVIVHSTDYTDMKRTDLALTAFAKAVKICPDIKLYITSTQPDPIDIVFESFFYRLIPLV